MARPGDLPPLVNPGDAGGRGEGGRGTAAELHGVATRVYDLWAADFAVEPRALALRRWAESTVFAWARELRGVGRAARPQQCLVARVGGMVIFPLSIIWSV